MGYKSEMKDFFNGKTVLLTGHTGFKGSWLSIMLLEMGAKVIGCSLDPLSEQDLFNQANLKEKMVDIRVDIRDLKNLKKIFKEHKPEIVFHLAAQALVRESYNDPICTFSTNVLGTANVLECIRSISGIKSTVIITTDKCYKNKEWIWGYRENDELGGHDPYSASKACAEIVIDSYIKSFLGDSETNVASARAGNVIGGGDWAKDRIVPDSIRALMNKKPIEVRNPVATRPWQHVLDPLGGYLLLGMRLYTDEKMSGAWNFGPTMDSIVSVKCLADSIISCWGSGSIICPEQVNAPHEAGLLALDIDKAHLLLGWSPSFGYEKAVELTVDWYKKNNETKSDSYQICVNHINEYFKE